MSIDIEELLKRIEELEERIQRLESDILPIRRIGPVLNSPIYGSDKHMNIELSLRDVIKEENGI